ncbi:MAG: TonB-dependent receptor [Acidobacteriia bacterium]|nr:TonB-dependent receptor [Terriglobia bacterium]
MRFTCGAISLLLSLAAGSGSLSAQQLLGGITGTVVDATGSAVPRAAVTVKNVDTNLQIKLLTSINGSYQASNLPIGNYSVSFSKDGFKTETHTSILVQGDRTATVNGSLEVGAVATTVEVTATPLLNAVDTTTGYVLDTLAINNAPLGTGSFTQLALLSPGLSADFLNGSGSNSGLGNQAIWANGQRDSSNSFTINGANADNLFNGKSTSQVASNRFTLNTGTSGLPGGDTLTSGSVYDAVGQGLPTPAPEMIQELRVNSGLYDASQGGKSGAQIETTTRSGTNQFHGMAYDHLQNTGMDANSFFRNAVPNTAAAGAPANNVVVGNAPALHYNRYGADVGGPIFKDKLFFFAGYQGIRDHDANNGTSTLTVPQHLTDDRSAPALAAMVQADFGKTIASSAISPAAVALFNAKVGNQFLIPTPTITGSAATALGYDAILIQASKFEANMGVGDLDYMVNNKDRMALKFFTQTNPTTNPFGGSATLGFPKVTQAGSQTATLDNTTVLNPAMTWENKAGFVRMVTYGQTGQPFTPGTLGIDVFGSTAFPGITITKSDPVINKGLTVGPTSNFANAGSYQNNYQGTSTFGWVKGRHTLGLGANWTHSQLNILNNNNNTASMAFTDWPTLFTGAPTIGSSSKYFAGSSNRYYRAEQVGAYVQDNFKLASNLTVNLGVRYDFDGPLSEKYGNLTNFHPDAFQYNTAADTIVNTGIVVAGNNKTLGTPGVSNSTLSGRQWGIAPRIGIVWSPSAVRNLVVRTGVGIYFDRGEYFSEFSPSAGSGFNGPFGVTLAPPFVQQVGTTAAGTLAQPFAGAALPAPVTNLNLFSSLFPNAASLAKGTTTYLFGGYDPTNKLPYSENWTLDLQWQPVNTVQLSLGYIGSHSVHQVLPIPFNQPNVATASNPINGQTTSYGFNVVPSETLKTFDGGNTDLRVPFLGISNSSVFYKAEGIATYNALQFGLRKSLSHGLQITGAYTWSHTLDEQSGLGLFYNGNNPSNPKQSYASSLFDRTHVAVVQVYYETPKVASGNALLKALGNGWAISSVTSLQSGLPYNPIDFSGAVAGQYYANFVELLDPEVPLKPGITAQQAQLQGSTGINPSKPILNAADFFVPQLAPGTNGVPTDCTAAGVCDTFETTFGGTGRDLFRGPAQKRLDISLIKTTRIRERYVVRFGADAFNVTNTPSFDVPTNSASQYSVRAGVPTQVALPASFGLIQHTIGSARFLQLSLTVAF